LGLFFFVFRFLLFFFTIIYIKTLNLADNNSKEWQESAKYAKQMAESVKNSKKSAEALKDIFGGISQEIFGISGAAWFKEVPKTTQELREQNKELAKMSKAAEAQAQKVGAAFKNTFGDVSDALEKSLSIDLEKELGPNFSKISKIAADINLPLEDFRDVDKIMEEIGKKGKEGFDDWKDYFDDWKEYDKLKKDFASREKKFIKESEKSFDIAMENNENFLKYANEQQKADIKRQMAGKTINQIASEQPELMRQIVSLSEDITGELDEQINKSTEINNAYKSMTDELSNSFKETFSLTKGLKNIASNVFSQMKDAIFEFDDAIHKAQTSTGIMFTENEYAMTQLTQKTAKFGMSVGETTDLMGALGDELNTTNFDVLSQAAGDLAAVQKATGASAEDISTIAGEMMRLGHSSADVKDAMENANVMAKRFGVNTKNVMSQVSRNIDKMRTMGFQGGEESLIKMAALAEKLHIQVDAIFDVAKRARTIEGSMEMAAELQLAGGSFANINPMDLLSAARKGPEELGKILTTMGADVGKFNEETGAYEFDPIDTDRLQMVADATGMQMEDLTNMISENALANQKLEMFPASMFEGEGMEGGQAFMEEMMKWDPEKKQFIATDELQALAEATGIDVSELENLNQSELKAMMEEKAIKDENLEKQAQANMSLKESFDNFIKSFLQSLTVLQPMLDFLGAIFQKFANIVGWLSDTIGPWAPLAAAALIAAAVKMRSILSSGIMGTMKKAAGGFVDTLKNGISKIPGLGGGKGSGGGIPGGDQASKIQDAAGGAGKAKGGILSSVAKEISSASKAGAKIDLKGIGKMSLAMVMLMAPLGIFAAIFTGTDPLLLVAAGFAIVELATAMWLTSKASGGIDIKNVAKFMLAAVIMSIALVPFAYAAQMMGEIDWGNVLFGMLTLVAVLALMGVIGMMAGAIAVPLLLGAVVLLGAALTLLLVGGMLAAASAFFGVAAENFQSFAEVDWGGMVAAGPALISLAAGMFAFALAGLLMFNPMMLLGMFVMFSALSMLSAIMPPLADGLEKAAGSIDKVAEGIIKLNEASQNISTEALERLSALGDTFRSLGGGEIKAVAEALYQLNGGGGGGSQGGGGGASSRKIEIDLKLNGSQIQQIVDEWQETAS
jgi:hypothetical protein